MEKNQMMEKIIDTSSKLNQLNKFNDIELEIKRLQTECKQIDNNLKENMQLASTRHQEMQALQIESKYSGKTAGGDVDIHRLCKLE